jgi:hypothetical protein
MRTSGPKHAGYFGHSPVGSQNVFQHILGDEQIE